MSKIISASRRTDIPAFQSDEFMVDVRKGYRDLKNPYTGKVDRYLLTPEEVICFVFWTKNPQPMIDRGYLDELTRMGYKFYFNYTITGLREADVRWEPGVPPLEDQLRSAIQITAKYPNTVRWRYDPIVLGTGANVEWHAGNFIHICRTFNRQAPTIKDCIFSFYQHYAKSDTRVAKRGLEIPKWKPAFQVEVIEELVAYATKWGIRMLSCAQPLLNEAKGIQQSKCIDADFIAPLLEWGGSKWNSLALLKKDRGQRKACGCVSSVDIGVYNTCPHSCAYCYANEADA
jgi:hypothetical protein